MRNIVYVVEFPNAGKTARRQYQSLQLATEYFQEKLNAGRKPTLYRETVTYKRDKILRSY